MEDIIKRADITMKETAKFHLKIRRRVSVSKHEVDRGQSQGDGTDYSGLTMVSEGEEPSLWKSSSRRLVTQLSPPPWSV